MNSLIIFNTVEHSVFSWSVDCRYTRVVISLDASRSHLFLSGFAIKRSSSVLSVYMDACDKDKKCYVMKTDQKDDSVMDLVHMCHS